MPDLSGKVAAITGGSRGIGYACTHTLLQRNIDKIYVLSDGKEGIEEALQSIRKEISPDAADKVKWIQVDIADWSAMAKAAEQIKSESDRLDILINDAGRGVMTYQVAENGIDRHMAANHFGHVVLTSKLLPLLKSTAEKGDKVRIVGVGSNLHAASPSDTKFASLEELNTDLGPNAQYGRSKLAVQLYYKYLSKHLPPNVLSNSIHPGIVATKMSIEDIHEPYPVGGYMNSVVLNPFKKDNFQGAVSTLFCATKTEKSGQYVCPPAVPEEGSSMYQDEKGELTENLMTLTKKLLREKGNADVASIEFY